MVKQVRCSIIQCVLNINIRYEGYQQEAEQQINVITNKGFNGDHQRAAVCQLYQQSSWQYQSF